MTAASVPTPSSTTEPTVAMAAVIAVVVATAACAVEPLPLRSSMVKPGRGVRRQQYVVTVIKSVPLRVAPVGSTRVPTAYVRLSVPSSTVTASPLSVPQSNAVKRQRRPARASAASMRHARVTSLPMAPDVSTVGSAASSGTLRRSTAAPPHGRVCTGASDVHVALSAGGVGQSNALLRHGGAPLSARRQWRSTVSGGTAPRNRFECKSSALRRVHVAIAVGRTPKSSLVCTSSVLIAAHALSCVGREPSNAFEKARNVEIDVQRPSAFGKVPLNALW
mmetsp:Transcript_37019/g.90716  ORF Transcript_37019/g.90716 Transcript_37019/m.90716 type:complete len:278 (-) Transcript_37019:1180-2013(-)